MAQPLTVRGFIEPGRRDVNTEQRVKHAVNETSCTELVCSVSCRRMDNNFVVIALGNDRSSVMLEH